MKIAVLVSGNGSNLQALIDAQGRDELGGGSIGLVISNKPEAFALERARKAGIKTFVLDHTGFGSRGEYDRQLVQKLKEENIELVVMAGFMRVLSEYFVDEYNGRMMNVHPSLLPSFRGVHGIKDAFEYGVKITGVTVHLVDKELDGGPVISQSCVRIEENDTLDTLEEKIHREEHKLYPEAVRLFVQGKIEVVGRKVRIRE